MRRPVDGTAKCTKAARLGFLDLEVDADARAWTATLDLADRFTPTLYDAAYVGRASR